MVFGAMAFGQSSIVIVLLGLTAALVVGWLIRACIRSRQKRRAFYRDVARQVSEIQVARSSVADRRTFASHAAGCP